MIWGEAGVGKTTFASKLAQDWAEVITGRQSKEIEKLTEEQRHLLSNTGLVLYIVFRDTREGQLLDDIVQSQIFDMIGEKSVKVSQKDYHQEILLICDGLDEVSYSNSELLDIINGRKYSKAKSITTCRPHSSLGMSLTADAEIRLKGFSQDQARHFVDMFFKIKYPTDGALAEKHTNELLDKILSSQDLLEMAINPSMLQLLCKIFANTGTIAKDRATVFKDYTCCLLQHHHIKCEGKRIRSKDTEKQYKDILLKSGKLALQGLKQSHLQLIFTEDDVTSLAGYEVYDIGFVSEIPSSDDIPKAQFIHKSLQEYLAAYFIVNSPDKIGMKYLMEFCSTSKGLMGSQIILTFITAQSKKMGKVIQKKIREFVSAWSSGDDVNPKDRTSFLLTMLKENRSLVFPLPNEVDINLREYETNIGWIQWFLQFFGQKNTLEQFFDFDNRGVQKISIVLGEKYRLPLMGSFRKSSLIECVINFQKRVSLDDLNHLKALIEHNKKLESISLTELNTQGVLDLFNQNMLISSLEKSNVKVMKIHESEFEMNAYISDALIHVPNHIALDLSSNKITDQSGYKPLLIKAAYQQVVMQECGIIIDTEIAEAISQLPEQANLDLSGNTVTKMDSSLLCHVIPVISNKKIDLSGLGVTINDKVAEVICELPDEADVDISNNTVTQMDINLFSRLLYRLNKDSKVTVSNGESSIETSLVEAIYCKPENTHIDMSCNDIYKQDAILSLILTAQHWTNIHKHNEENKEKEKNVGELCQRSKQITLEIHRSNTDKINPKLVTLISCHEGIKCPLDTLTLNKEFIESLIVKALKQGNVHVKGNKVSEKHVCVTFNKAVDAPSMNISKCGIQIDTEIVEAVSRLPVHTQLDLSGNDITKMKPYLLSMILSYMTKQEKIDIDGWGITVDEDIVRALSKLSKLHTLIIKYGYHSNNKLTSTAASKLPHTVSSMPHLQDLRLDHCNVSNDVMVALTDSLYKHCPLLKDLSLRYNHLSSGVWEVLKHIQQMKNLIWLWLRGNPCVKDDKQSDKIKTTLHRSNPGLSVELNYY